MQARVQNKNGRPDVPHEGVAEILSRIRPKRQEMVRQVLEHPLDYVLLSVRKMAEKLNLDPSTLLRTILAMGFPQYSDFQRYLHELSVAHATSLDLTGDAVISEKAPEAQIQAAVRQDQQNLRALFHGLDVNRASALAPRFYSARRIVLFGGDAAESLVHYFEYQLNVLGLPVVSAVSAGSTIHLARAVAKSDLVIAMSFRRALRQTVDGLQQSRAAGAYCVGITDTSISAIARCSNEYFLVSTDAPFGVSYVAPMSLLNALVSSIAFHQPKRTMALLRELDKEQRTGYRWHDKEEHPITKKDRTRVF
jgi:RpiR family transcriptional regulator, carbohydrate utilization regulator